MNKLIPGRDQLFAQTDETLKDFVFDERVAAVFPDMINRSVPGYSNIIGMIGVLAHQHAQPDSRLYDLGCSLGAATAALQQGTVARGCEIHAIDNAPAMIDRARSLLDANAAPPIYFHCGDVREQSIEQASIVVMNFTLQFIPIVDRQKLLHRIHRGMLSDGILILSEKIAGKDAAEDQLLIDLHHEFKRANGYSDLEISQKRAALEDVLVPERLDVHRQRLLDAGFSRVDLWFQCFNFISLIARA